MKTVDFLLTTSSKNNCVAIAMLQTVQDNNNMLVVKKKDVKIPSVFFFFDLIFRNFAEKLWALLIGWER